MAGARMTPVESENARRMALAVDDGPELAAAPARPALGFVLDSTTREDVGAWAQREHVSCEDARPGLIRCHAVPPAALGIPEAAGKVDELALELDRHGRLVDMTTFRTRLTPEAASVAARTAVASLVLKLGQPRQGTGDFEAARLGGPSAASISTVRYRFRNYVADVTAMDAPSGGASLREHFMSAMD